MMMMFSHDPFYGLLSIVGLALAFLPQLWVKSTYNHFRKVPAARGLTGAQVAQAILSENGAHQVSVEMVAGELSDHYDPSAKAVRLSPDNFQGTSVAASAIAAHEVGHALQHAAGYQPVVWRSALVPMVNLGSSLGPILLMTSLGLGYTSQHMPQWAYWVALLGVTFYSFSVLFHLVTLPVEIDASSRAMRILRQSAYLNAQELPGAQKVLTVAACTYVATALYSLMELLYWVFRLLGARRNDD